MTGVPEETDQIDGNALTMVRVFDAPPERVFDAWTKPELLAEWWGPEWVRTPADSIRVAPEVGGEWSATMVGADGEEFPSDNVITLLERPSRIELVTAPGSPVRATLQVSLEVIGGRTVMTVVNRVLIGDADLDAMAQGWQSMLGRMRGALTAAGAAR